MRIIFIPFKRSTVLYLLASVILFLLVLSMGWNETISVLNMKSYDPIYKGNEEKKIIAFECNVVWGTEYIPQLLEIFNKEQINITFFIGGKWADDNPDLLKQIVENGHEIGNHGYNHKHHKSLNLEQNRKEILDTEETVKRITGIKTKLFAPPYGEFNETTLNAAKALGYKTIMWSIDTIDWRGDGVAKITQRVLKNPHNGAFVLMHPTKDTVDALPYIIKELKNRGFSIGTVSDLLN